MISMFVYSGFVVLVTAVTTMLFRASQPIPALAVAGAGAFGVILCVAQEAYDAVELAGRMEPIAALLGAGLISIMTGVGIADGLCDYLSKELDKS